MIIDGLKSLAFSSPDSYVQLVMIVIGAMFYLLCAAFFLIKLKSRENVIDVIFVSSLSQQHPLRDSRAHLDFPSSTSNAVNGAVTKAFLHAKHVHPGIRNGKADLDVFARTVFVAVVITYRRGLIVRGQRCCFREKTRIEGIGNRQFDANRHLTIDHRHETVDLKKSN